MKPCIAHHSIVLRRMKFCHTIGLYLLLLICVFGNEEISSSGNDELPANHPLIQEAVSLRQTIKKRNTEFGDVAGKHVADMSKMEAEKQSLQKQYNDLVARITELSKKKSNNQEKIQELRKSRDLMKTKDSESIASVYLKSKLNTLLVDFVYPVLFTILKVFDSLFTFISEKARFYWRAFTQTEFYSQASMFLSHYWTIAKTQMAEWWTLGLATVNEKIGYDVSQSAVVVKVREVAETVYMYCRPYAVHKVLDTLRLSLQVNELVSSYAEVVFYLFIGVWVLIFVTSIITLFG